MLNESDVGGAPGCLSDAAPNSSPFAALRNADTMLL
jgi:hypothetical protein